MAASTKKITQSEDVNSFYAKYVAMLEEAEIGNMSKEELHGMLTIIALEPIRDLQEKVFKLEGQPSLQQVQAKMQKWRIRKVLNKAATSTSTKVNAIRGRGAGANKGPGAIDALPIAPAHIKNTPHSMYSRCYTCGSPDHARHHCPKGHDAKCKRNGCGKAGHYKSTHISNKKPPGSRLSALGRATSPPSLQPRLEAAEVAVARAEVDAGDGADPPSGQLTQKAPRMPWPPNTRTNTSAMTRSANDLVLLKLHLICRCILRQIPDPAFPLKAT